MDLPPALIHEGPKRMFIQAYGGKNGNDQVAMAVRGLINELNFMSKKQGYSDFYSYIREEKGELYAQRVLVNITETFKYLNNE